MRVWPEDSFVILSTLSVKRRLWEITTNEKRSRSHLKQSNCSPRWVEMKAEVDMDETEMAEVTVEAEGEVDSRATSQRVQVPRHSR